MNRAPSQKMLVYLGAPTIQLSHCQLEFTPQNFNNWQTVTLNPAPFFPSSLLSSTRPPENISVRFFVGNGQSGCPRDTKTRNILVKYSMPSGKICTSYGDPHYKTFDGAVYDLYKQGDYFLVKSELLDILTRLGAYTNPRSVNKEMYVRFGTTFYMRVSIQGKTLQFATFGGPFDGLASIDYSEYETSDKRKLVIKFVDGSSITVTLGHNDLFLNIQVNLSGYFFNKVTGLCGNFNSDKSDDTLSSYDAYVAASAENYFIRGTNAMRTTATIAPHSQVSVCQLPESATRRNLAEAAVITRDMAARHCNSLLKQRECLKIVNATSYLMACESDIMATVDLASGKDAMDEYLAVCADIAKSVAAVGDASVKATAAEVLKKVSRTK